MFKKITIYLSLFCLFLTSCATEITPVGGGEILEQTTTATTSIAQTTTTVTSTTPPPPPEPEIASVALAGDVLIHTQVWKSAALGEDKYDFTSYFSDIKDYVSSADLAICNLENPVNAYGDNQKLSSYPMFNAPEEILDAVKYAGFDTVTTANNHAFDKKFEGLTATLENIKEAGLEYTGTYATAEDYDEYLIQEINGIKIAIISYSQLDNGMGSVIPEDKRGFAMRRFEINDSSLLSMTEDINNCRELGADIVITALHWGAEYVDKPTTAMVDFAHGLVDNGADVVWGGHSHCVQPVEVYNDKYIFYSLGNFFVDQIGLNPPKPKTAYGAVVKFDIIKEPTGEVRLDSGEIYPTYTYRYSDSNSPNGRSYKIVSEDSKNKDIALPAFQHVEKIMNNEVISVYNALE